jgi:hypothetical protein
MTNESSYSIHYRPTYYHKPYELRTREKDFGAHLFYLGVAFSFEGVIVFVALRVCKSQFLLHPRLGIKVIGHANLVTKGHFSKTCWMCTDDP